MQTTWLDRLVYRLTHRRWNRLISRVLCQHAGLAGAGLRSSQFHELSAEFDPTQNAAPWEGTLLEQRRVRAVTEARKT